MRSVKAIPAVIALTACISTCVLGAGAAIDPASINATASSVNYQLEAVYSCNGNGLTGDLHTNNIGGEPPAAGQGTMWLADGIAGQWIIYEFDRIYSLNVMWVWNYNQVTASGGDRTGRGVRDCTIEYSTDGTAWNQLGTTHTLAKANASSAYAHNTQINFGQSQARYVKIAVISNHGYGSLAGLSEVRFYSGNTVGFAQASSSGHESETPVQLPVVMTSPSAAVVTVDYAVTGGSAANGSDYSLSSGILTFNPGQTLKEIGIPITQDGQDEDDETIEITLSNLAGGQDIQLQLGAATHTYTISDLISAPFPDDDTVALWLFDEANYPHTTITDASRYAIADLCLMDGGSLARGLYGRALQVSGSDWPVSYAGFAGKVPEEELRENDGTPSGLWGPTEGPGALLNGLKGNSWTVELWVWFLSPPGTNPVCLLDMGQAYDPGFTLTCDNNGFHLVNRYAGIQADCPTGDLTGPWHHIAFTKSGSTVRHYLDGVLQPACSVSSATVQPIPNLQKPNDREHESRGFESMNAEQRRQNRFNLAVCTDRQNSQRLNGFVDETRISRVARYGANFTPGSFSRNYGSGVLSASTADGPALLFNPGPISVPVQFGARKHVFIDDAIMETQSGTAITMNRPYGKQQISGFTVGDSAWRPSVYDVNGVVYMAMPEGYGSETGDTYLATSADGINFSMQGTIITETPLYGAFFRDLNPNINPAELYKLNTFVANRGMYMYISPDGLNWRRNETIQLALRSGGGGECFWDDQRGRYASYLKRDSSFDDPECANTSGRVATGFWSQEILKAWPFNVMLTPYFEGYPFPAVTCEGPVSFGITGATQVYRTRAIKYPWAPDTYLAFVWRYPGDNAARHVDLGVCRDGESWDFFATNYPGGPWYIPYGSAEEELSIYGLIRRGDEIWQYVDEGGGHGGSAERRYYRYRQRLDGFVSLDAGGSGTATTYPLVLTGDRLELNIKSTGVSKVAVLNQAGQEISGFGLADCDAITTDSVRHAVTWAGNPDILALAGQTVRLKFQLQNAKLYAFEIVDEPASGPCGLYDDSLIDGKDLKVLVEDWLESGTATDLNQDGTVNFKDYAALAAMWLESCL